MNFSNKVERNLTNLVHASRDVQDGSPIYISQAEEDALYQRALAEELLKDSRVKAAGNVRLGEIILMVDSDTRVVSRHVLSFGVFY